MPEIYLVSTLLMGVLAIAIALVIARMGQRATPSGHAGGRSGYAEWSTRNTPQSSRIVGLANTPAVWTGLFITIAIVFLAGVVLVIEGGEMIDVAALQTAVLAVGGAVLIGYVFLGSYFAARDRFGNSATGVAIASATLGLLILIGVVVRLLLG